MKTEDEKTPAGATPRRYFNRVIYTDVQSWEILEMDEARGVATVVEVTRDFKPKWVRGGFSAICTNLDDQRDAPVVRKPNAEPFEVVRHRGAWGYWEDALLFGCCVSDLTPEGLRKFRENPNAVFSKNARGMDTVAIYERTKAGRRKRRFRKLGQPEAECRAFYDHNF